MEIYLCFFQREVSVYQYYGEERSTCQIKSGSDEIRIKRIFYGCFFAFGYVIPLSAICGLYGFILKRLLFGAAPDIRHNSVQIKQRSARVVFVVVIVFALCWLPIQIILVIQNFGTYNYSMFTVGVVLASQCLAYMNSCVNPILYSFLSTDFRRSFRKLLCCGKGSSVDRGNYKVKIQAKGNLESSFSVFQPRNGSDQAYPVTHSDVALQIADRYL